MVNWGKKWWPWVLFIVLPVLIMLPVMLTHQMHYKLDMWYNIMRIQEMNAYWHSLTWPGLGNIYSFGQAGQLMQGMYPSFTLAILVGLTSFLSGINQIYAIIILLVIAMSSTFFWAFKKVLQNNILAFVSTIIMVYPMVFVCALERGQFGMVLAYIFLPLIFYGLRRIQVNDRLAPIYIGLGVGLIWLSHISSGIFVVILVAIMGGVDLILGRKNFWKYVQSGLLAGLIALPTLIKVLLLNSHIMGVFTRGLESDLNLIDIFKPIWEGGTGYFTVLYLIGMIYVIATVYRKSTMKTMKITSIIMMLMATSVAYLVIFQPLQFPSRFLLYAFPLAMFIMLIELPEMTKNWQSDNQRLIYILLVLMAVVPAINASIRIDKFVSSKPLWQVEENYARTRTKINRETLENPDFQKTRTYIDYMPIQQKKTAEKNSPASSSKNMRDVNAAKSVRLTGFKSSEIKMQDPKTPMSVDGEKAAKNRVIPYQPATNIKAEKRTLSMNVTVNKNGTYDLPFWMYKYVSYSVTVDGKSVTPKQSKQGRMSVPLTKGAHRVAITQNFPVLIFIAYIISILTMVATGIFMYRTRKTTSKEVTD